VVSSVRDIPQGDERPPDYGRRVAAAVQAAFDLILVHGDSAVIDLRTLIPDLANVSRPIIYTGYLGAPCPFVYQARGPVLLDLGGGWGSDGLVGTILSSLDEITHPATRRQVLVLAGIHAVLTQDLFDRYSRLDVSLLKDVAVNNLPAISTYITRMGYNSSVQALSCNVPTIGIPHKFSSEQQLRAGVLEKLGRLIILGEESASRPPALGRALDRAESRAKIWLPLRPSSGSVREALLNEMRGRARQPFHRGTQIQ
jgi:predicted glycosyltransferase